MKRTIFSIIQTAICAVAVCALMAACAPAGAGTTGSPKASSSKAGPPTKQEKETPAPTGLYAKDIKPLTPVECGRCHKDQYTLLKEKGGKHQFECTDCHEQFHTYNPLKKNWDAIMPKCGNCHDLPHGKEFTSCMDCHQQPHAPKEIPFAKLDVTVDKAKGVVLCARCHTAEGAEFMKFPTKHNTEVNCQGCHAEPHGTIPSCLDCHDPHVPNQKFNECLLCHSPHSALNIKKYPETVPNKVCGSCHEEPYKNLQTNVTKHSALQCATCHTSHGEIPACEDCHGKPHSATLHKQFPDCLKCHNDPHNLPVSLSK